MFHLLMLVSGFGLAIGWRLTWRPEPQRRWHDRWNFALMTFAGPPLLLLTTAIALLWMGPICHMARHLMSHGWSGILSDVSSWAYCLILLGFGLKLLSDGRRSLWRLRQYQQITLPTAVNGISAPTARLIPESVPFIAQIGLWQPELVVSQGLLTELDAPHLTAVLCHEAAHRYYADTIWFAALGLLRRGGGWLPQTTRLWHELLLLRELRADRWAAQQVDPLLLAEALFTVVSAPLSMEFGAAFNEAMVGDRLNERIDALLEMPATEPSQSVVGRFRQLAWGLVLLPLLTIVLHQVS
jgi:Zn-dependent protease with chaperone function